MPCAIERAEQVSRIAISQVGFAFGDSIQLSDGRFRHTCGTIAAAGKPYRIYARVVGQRDETVGALLVAAREMAFLKKTLLVKDQFGLRMGLGCKRVTRSAASRDNGVDGAQMPMRTGEEMEFVPCAIAK